MQKIYKRQIWKVERRRHTRSEHHQNYRSCYQAATCCHSCRTISL